MMTQMNRPSVRSDSTSALRDGWVVNALSAPKFSQEVKRLLVLLIVCVSVMGLSLSWGVTQEGRSRTGLASAAATSSNATSSNATSASATSTTNGEFGPGDIVVNGRIKALSEIEVPSSVTGKINAILVNENSLVDEGTVLAHLDDQRAQTALRLAQARLSAAELEANDDSAVLEAEAALELANKSEARLEAISRKGAGSKAELEEAQLSARVAQLRLQKMQKEREHALTGLEVSRLECDEAQQQIERHKIKSETTANVMTIYRQPGEWVREGEPILRLIRMDRLRIEAHIESQYLNREDVHSRPVTIIYDRANGEQRQFQGRIIYTGLYESNDKIHIRAEIDNEIVDDHWVLHPGADVQLVIHTDRSLP